MSEAERLGHRGHVLCVLALLVAIPSAWAAPLVDEDACAAQVGCAGHATCDTSAACVVKSCDNVAGCRAELSQGSTCAINDTISGHTCTTQQGVAFDGVLLSATQSEGNVTRLNLPNSWTSDGLDVSGSIAGVTVPSSSVGLYQSTIQVGPHSFNSVSLFLLMDGMPAQFTVFALDGVPAGCFAYSDVVAHATLDCRDATSLIPIRP